MRHDGAMSLVSVSSTMSCTPAQVYDLISNVTRMGQWSPETTSCRWLGGVDGPAPGARFRGTNQRGLRRWSTTCTVTAADPGRRFAFTVAFGPIPVAEWAYDVEAADGGCQVTESWTDRRAGWMRVGGAIVMGVPDRAAHNRITMTATLAALKTAAESAAATSR